MSARSLRGRFRVGKAPHAVDLHLEGSRLSGTIDDAPVVAEVSAGGPGEVVLEIGGRRVLAVVVRTAARTWVSIGGAAFEVVRAAARDPVGAAPAAADPFAASPMTGVLSKVHVKPGDAAPKGAPLFAVEAMKMEYVVAADRAVVVAEVRRAQGDRVSIGEVVVTYRDDAR